MFKKKYFSLIISLLTFTSAIAQLNIERVNQRMIFLDPSYYRSMDHNSNDLDLMYSVADLYALKGEKDSAFYYLMKPIQLCPSSLKKCEEVYMPDVLGNICYDNLHETKEWKNFELKIKSGFLEIYTNVQQPQVAYDLLVAKGEDQSVRYYASFFKDRLKKRSLEVSKKNTAFIKKVIDRYGYPTIALVGDRASRAAFLLCQHADNDLKFQKKVLSLIKNSGEVPKQDIAYLTDRVMVAEEGKQLYGTQFMSMNDKILYPIKDSSNVDERRIGMGLNTLSEYLNSF